MRSPVPSQATIPLGRYGTPDEIGRVGAFLMASAQAGGAHGSPLPSGAEGTRSLSARPLQRR